MKKSRPRLGETKLNPFTGDLGILKSILKYRLFGDNKVQRRRNTKILFKGNYVKYPFENGLITVKNYSWGDIAREYYKNIYSKLLEGGML